jgi:hypothetical protein
MDVDKKTKINVKCKVSKISFSAHAGILLKFFLKKI